MTCFVVMSFIFFTYSISQFYSSRWYIIIVLFMETFSGRLLSRKTLVKVLTVVYNNINHIIVDLRLSELE
ncbi:hypothetical protein WUni_008970 [Wolbachia endosymbiont of Muscidifurax uniraptor]|nr:hypothetical protein WUni_008970 [Wolbachia endosymbiont of Muscidifurax uniraptor]